jgi:hypothetical protein
MIHIAGEILVCVRAPDTVDALFVLAVRTPVSVGEDRVAVVARPAHSLTWLLEDTLYRRFGCVAVVGIVARHVVEFETVSAL